MKFPPKVVGTIGECKCIATYCDSLVPASEWRYCANMIMDGLISLLMGTIGTEVKLAKQDVEVASKGVLELVEVSLKLLRNREAISYLAAVDENWTGVVVISMRTGEERPAICVFPMITGIIEYNKCNSKEILKYWPKRPKLLARLLSLDEARKYVQGLIEYLKSEN